jgi:glycosyltransferase involved in cell wall biosynthesis
MAQNSNTMNRPFFSILLPTKNRSEIIGGAVESALRQTFADFELVVSDNDDSPTATRDAVAQFKDPRVRYFRTPGNLPMHENWENALSHATGRFVLILEDKMRMVENALAILSRLIQQHGEVVISYDVRFLRQSALPALDPVPEPASIQSTDAAELFRRFDVRFFRMHPKSLDSCAPLEVIHRARANSPTGMFFSHVTPDYSSGFLLLGTVDYFLFLEAALVYVPNNWMAHGRYSVGQASYQKAALTARWLKELPVSVEEIQSYSPVKCQWLWINNAMYDYFTKYAKRTDAPPPDWVCFHAFCLMIVVMGWQMGADMSEDLAAIRSSLARNPLGFRLRVYAVTVQRLSALGWLFISNRFK